MARIARDRSILDNPNDANGHIMGTTHMLGPVAGHSITVDGSAGDVNHSCIHAKHGQGQTKRTLQQVPRIMQ